MLSGDRWTCCSLRKRGRRVACLCACNLRVRKPVSSRPAPHDGKQSETKGLEGAATLWLGPLFPSTPVRDATSQNVDALLNNTPVGVELTQEQLKMPPQKCPVK